MGGARAIHLLPQESFELTAAKAANPEIGSFLDAMRTEVARGAGTSLEGLTGDYTKTNYSSSRMGNAESHKVHAGRRARVLAPFLSWVLELFVEELFIREPELLPSNVSFYDNRDALTNCTWIGSPPVDPDPEKTAKAAEKRLSGGYTTLEYECGILGLDWQEVMIQQHAEMTFQKELGNLELRREIVDSQQPTPEPQTGGGQGDAE
jgi:capsid protein